MHASLPPSVCLVVCSLLMLHTLASPTCASNSSLAPGLHIFDESHSIVYAHLAALINVHQEGLGAIMCANSDLV